MCSFRRAMAIAISSAKRRSCCRESLRCRESAARRLPERKLRMRSRASWNSLSSLACSGHDIARVEREHMKHLLKTSRKKVTERRTKGKQYFRLLFAFGPCYPRDDSSLEGASAWTNNCCLNFWTAV